MRRILVLLILFGTSALCSQRNNRTLPLEEYLGLVKKNHPIVKQALLIITESEIKLLKARGAFDPKVNVAVNRKLFKGLEYYNTLKSTFKIPTWYGIELKAKYENNEGTYLNPALKTPTNGLYSAGISIPLAKGLLINDRMATLKQAQLYQNQAQAKQQQMVNDILFDASKAYFNWLKKYQEKLVYQEYLVNAETRLSNLKKSFINGDKAAIDTLEAHINVNNRLLDQEKIRIDYVKSTLELSNFLWLDDNVPLELKPSIHPDLATNIKLDAVLTSSILANHNEIIEAHPKIRELNSKKEVLVVNQKLKRNNLLPVINFEYNFLTSGFDEMNSFNVENFQTGLRLNFPLFLRKERAELRLAKQKIRDIDFDISSSKVLLLNKIKGLSQEIASYKRQHTLLMDLVKDYKKFVSSEERKFNVGEGSLFLVNYREVKFIESQLKEIQAAYNLFLSKSKLLRTLATL